MKIDWKKILGVVGGLVILAGVAIGVEWLRIVDEPIGAMPGLQNRDSTGDVVKVDVSGWSTYEDDRFNFEFKYPASLKQLGKSWVHDDGNYETSFSTAGDFFKAPTSKDLYLFFKVFPKGQFGPANCDVNNEKKDFIAGMNVKIFEGSGCFSGDLNGRGPEMDNNFQVFFTKGDYDFVFIFRPYSDENKKLVEGILSTFKFIEPEVDTSGWKTYTNDRFGFEFKYPKDWADDQAKLKALGAKHTQNEGLSSWGAHIIYKPELLSCDRDGLCDYPGYFRIYGSYNKESLDKLFTEYVAYYLDPKHYPQDRVSTTSVNIGGMEGIKFVKEEGLGIYGSHENEEIMIFLKRSENSNLEIEASYLPKYKDEFARLFNGIVSSIKINNSELFIQHSNFINSIWNKSLDTSGWKVWKSGSGLFEIKYPSLLFSEGTDGDDSFLFGSMSFDNDEWRKSSPNGFQGYYLNGGCSEDGNSSGLSPQQWFDQKWKGLHEYGGIGPVKYLTIGIYPAVMFVAGEAAVPSAHYSIFDGTRTCSLICEESDYNTNYLCETVLSTIKFLK